MVPLLILPTYNEAATILEVIDAALGVDGKLEILVVDDGSSDGTADLVKALAGGADGRRLHLLERPEKLGLGEAYKAGFSWALDRPFDVVIEMDADLQHDPEQISRLLDAIARGADLAVGSRYIEGGSLPRWRLSRRLLSRGGNRLARFLLRLPVADSTSGFRAYRAELLSRIDLAAVSSQGYAFQVEMVFRCHRCGAQSVEVPITFSDRVAGDSKMTPEIVFEAVRMLVRLAPVAWAPSPRSRS